MNDDIKSTIMDLCEGNPGAISVLARIGQLPDPLNTVVLDKIQELGHRGSDIWVGYKDACGESLEAYMTACVSPFNDPDRLRMLEAVQTQRNRYGG